MTTPATPCTAAHHDALKGDLAAFRAATDFHALDPTDGTETLEMRNCRACRSTLAVVVEPAPVPTPTVTVTPSW